MRFHRCCLAWTSRMWPRQLQGRRVLLTGASSGIGRALARRLAGSGAHLLLTARRQDRLQQLAKELRELNGAVTFSAGDITDAATRRQLLQIVEQRWGALDLLVNNAGRGAIGPFSSASEDRLRHIM